MNLFFGPGAKHTSGTKNASASSATWPIPRGWKLHQPVAWIVFGPAQPLCQGMIKDVGTETKAFPVPKRQLGCWHKIMDFSAEENNSGRSRKRFGPGTTKTDSNAHVQLCAQTLPAKDLRLLQNVARLSKAPGTSEHQHQLCSTTSSCCTRGLLLWDQTRPLLAMGSDQSAFTQITKEEHTHTSFSALGLDLIHLFETPRRSHAQLQHARFINHVVIHAAQWAFAWGVAWRQRAAVTGRRCAEDDRGPKPPPLHNPLHRKMENNY